MKNLLTTAALLCLLSCNKKFPEHGPDRLDQQMRSSYKLLKNNPLYKSVNSALKQYNPSENLLKIDSILFLKYKENEARLVYYHSNLGTSNILLQGINDGNETYAASSTKCSGSCDCVLEVVIQNDGSASLNCSCSDCSMISRAVIEEGTAP